MAEPNQSNFNMYNLYQIFVHSRYKIKAKNYWLVWCSVVYCSIVMCNVVKLIIPNLTSNNMAEPNQSNFNMYNLYQTFVRSRYKIKAENNCLV